MIFDIYLLATSLLRLSCHVFVDLILPPSADVQFFLFNFHGIQINTHSRNCNSPHPIFTFAPRYCVSCSLHPPHSEKKNLYKELGGRPGRRHGLSWKAIRLSFIEVTLVDIKPDKKLLNVVFPDGRDGQTFTLKSETIEDLYEWKNTLETAIAQAPSATPVTGEIGILNGEQAESAAAKGHSEQILMDLHLSWRKLLISLNNMESKPKGFCGKLQMLRKLNVVCMNMNMVKRNFLQMRMHMLLQIVSSIF